MTKPRRIRREGRRSSVDGPGKERLADVPSDRELGIDAAITRRDFLNGTMLGVGAALLGAPSPALARRIAAPDGRAIGLRPGAGTQGAVQAQDPWTGYGGVGDYARSNGNTWPVLEAAHRIRDGAYVDLPSTTVDTGELYDLVVVGGGLSGLTAAWRFSREAGANGSCLVIENHPIFGGEAKQNDFMVDGVRLVGPQGSNQFGAPREGSRGLTNEIWTDLGLPRDFEYVELDPSVDPIRVPLDNYTHMEGVYEQNVDVGYYFDQRNGASGPTWMRNIWADELRGTPFPEPVRADLVRWRTTGPPQGVQDFRRSIDGMSYADYIEGEMGLSPEVTKMAAPVVGLINGASPDGVSAAAAAQIGMPGVSRPRSGGSLPRSFPGGNSTLARHLVKRIVPGAYGRATSFDEVFDAPLAFDTLDRPGSPVRIRLGATVVRVQHAGAGGDGDEVAIAYEKGGTVYRVRARTVVMATGGWVNKHVLADIPAEMRAAYDTFVYAPAMVVNVALTNWRFLYRLGVSCCRWFDDEFGFSCNIRRPMVAGGSRIPLHPDRPTVLTYYMGLYTAGMTAAEQGAAGRAALMATTFADYERRIRAHMLRLFASSGFDAGRDIAGIVLNRWGHARLVQSPGFYFGRNGQPPAPEIVQAGYGRVMIGHSELNGHQSMTGAMSRGAAAAEQALARL